MTRNDFNPNDPKYWKDFDPFSKAEEFIDNKSEGKVGMARRNRIIAERHNKGVKKSAESIRKRKASMPDQSGENNPFYGKSHKTETRAKISAKKKGSVPINKGTKHTDEALEKMRKPRSEEGKMNMRGPREKRTCPHCGKEGAGGNMGRYHFDNCKSKP